MSENGDEDGFVVTCSHCGRRFSQRKGLYAHMRQFHPGEDFSFKRKCLMFCCLCNDETFSMSMYMDHIRSKHTDVQLSFEKRFFYCDDDFKKWKSEMEQQTGSHFTVRRSAKKLADGRTSQQYQCDRSGIFKPSTGESKRKFSGSKKIGKTCPAHFTLLKTVVGDLMEIEVNFQNVHIGHKFDVLSLRRRSAKRERRLLAKAARARSDESNAQDPKKDTGNVCLNENSATLVKDMYDIFTLKPDVEVQQMSCTCKEYAVRSMCDHVEMICRSLKIDMANNAVSSDDSRDLIDSAFVSAEEIDMVEELPNLKQDLDEKSLEERRASILEEVRKLVYQCHTSEQLRVVEECIEKLKSKISLLRPLET